MEIPYDKRYVKFSTAEIEKAREHFASLKAAGKINELIGARSLASDLGLGWIMENTHYPAQESEVRHDDFARAKRQGGLNPINEQRKGWREFARVLGVEELL